MNAISLPLTVRYLGAEQYGIWVTVSTSVVLIAMLDLGIASSLTNMISRAYAEDDKAAAQRFYASAFWSSCGVSGLLGLLCWAGWGRVPWNTVFHLSNPGMAGQAEACVAIAVVFFLVSLPLNLVNRVLSGYQQTQVSNYANLLNGFLGLLAILIVVFTRGSLVELMLVYSAMMLAGTFALNIWVMFRDKRWLVPVPGAMSREAIRELLGSGFGFFVLQLAGLIVFNSDNFVIAHYLGASDVTPYSVTWRMASYASALQAALLPALWPAYSEAYTRGDYVWVRQVFWKTARLSMGIAAVAVVVLALFGRTIIRIYAGPEAVPSEVLLIAICGWTLMSAGMDLQGCLLAALNRIKLQGALSLISALLNIALSIYFVRHIGSLGAVVGTILSYALIMVVPIALMVYRALYPCPNEASAVGARLRKIMLPVVWLFAIWRLRLGMRLLEFAGILPANKRCIPSEPERFLVAYLTKHVGDLVLMFPMLEALRKAHPSARIEVAVQKDAALLMSAVPQVDYVWSFDVPGRSATTAPAALRLSWSVTGEYLRLMAGHEQPTVCVVPRWDDDGFRSGDLAYLTRARRRVGFDFTVLSDRLPFGEGTFTDRVPRTRGMHEPTKGIYLLQCVGLLPAEDLDEVSVKPVAALRNIAAVSDWNSLANRLGIAPGEFFAVIAPGATQARRIWPLERWVEVGKLLQEAGLFVVVLSGPDDAYLAHRLHQLLETHGRSGKSRAVAGVTSIPETATLLAHSQIFLGADSGPGHIAGGLGIPSVIQFIAASGSDPNGGHSPERFRPAGPDVTCVRVPHTIEPCVGACAADCAHCILTIETEAMLAVVRPVLAEISHRGNRVEVIR